MRRTNFFYNFDNAEHKIRSIAWKVNVEICLWHISFKSTKINIQIFISDLGAQSKCDWIGFAKLKFK